MKTRHYGLLFVILVLSSLLVACGPQGPESDIDINARVLEIYADTKVLRVGEFDAGRKYEIYVADSVSIDHAGTALGLTDLQPTWQVRIWANKVSGKDWKYEAVQINVIDTGEAAPARR